MTNDEEKTYVVKRFSLDDKEESAIPTYAQINTAMGTWANKWNDEILHRNYWACSPAYYNTTFPQVSDDIADISLAKGEGTGAGVTVAPYGLRYFSYNQIMSDELTASGFTRGTSIAADGEKTYRYAFENTMAAEAFNAINPNACGPAAIIVGQYSIKNSDGIALPENTTFYMSTDDKSGNLYFERGSTYGTTALQYLVGQTTNVLAIDQKGTPLTAENITKWGDYFEVSHPEKDVRRNAAVPHRYVTLQLKSLLPADAPLYYNPVGTDQWLPLTVAGTTAETAAELLTTINTLLWQKCGVLRAYKNGMAYFHVMIQHLRATEDGVVDGKPAFMNGNNIDWEKCRIGDFGLVRNHVYNLEVSKINGMGSGILDPEYPLVPSTKSDKYFIKYRLNILNWRIVPTQGGIVLGN